MWSGSSEIPVVNLSGISWTNTKVGMLVLITLVSHSITLSSLGYKYFLYTHCICRSACMHEPFQDNLFLLNSYFYQDLHYVWLQTKRVLYSGCWTLGFMCLLVRLWVMGRAMSGPPVWVLYRLSYCPPTEQIYCRTWTLQ